MTCEVVVLNRLGLSLAADSAVTFSSNDPSNNGSRTYSSGVNKIFQLAEKEAVGVMVFNAASMQDVPWELIIKSFRTKFGASSCPRLADYKKELADFIEQQYELFPLSHREKQLEKLFARSALIFVRELMKNSVLVDAAQLTSHSAEWAKFIQDIETLVNGTPLAHFFTTNDVSDAQIKFGPWLKQEIDSFVSTNSEIQHLSTYFSDPKVSEIVIEGTFKFYQAAFGTYTGVVLAGYGKDDYFPAYHQTKYFGFVGEKLVWCDEATASVGHDQASAIEAFAMKSMVETFLTGVAPSIWGGALRGFKTHAEQACSEVLTKAGAALPAGDMATIVEQARNNFQNEWNNTRMNEHYFPLVDVVAGLTVEEMGELAETLVMLESLKEKVTLRTQSVGGPVDVAVITKAEGLVWIKRKHYFSSELNHRYFSRQK